MFIGGAINAAVLQAYGDFLLHIPSRPLTGTGEQILYAWTPLILIFFAPIILSLVLTTFQPEKQIVPPIWIQVVSFAWYAGFAYIKYSAEFVPLIGVYAFYTVFAGYAQTQMVAPILGIVADRASISVRGMWR